MSNTASDKAPVVKSTIHLNGTSAQDLYDQYSESLSYLNSALEALPNPNGRDYYPQGENATRLAIEQMNDRRLRINGVITEIEEILTSISDEMAKRETVKETAKRTGRPEGEVLFEATQGRPWNQPTA